jgi:hypothetical protein
LPDREIKRLNERGRKAMKKKLNEGGGGRASIAGKPLLAI